MTTISMLTPGVDELLATLKEDCKSEGIATLEKQYESLKKLCTTTKETDKNKLFLDTAKTLGQIEADCPQSKETVAALMTILLVGMGVKCGGS